MLFELCKVYAFSFNHIHMDKKSTEPRTKAIKLLGSIGSKKASFQHRQTKKVYKIGASMLMNTRVMISAKRREHDK